MGMMDLERWTFSSANWTGLDVDVLVAFGRLGRTGSRRSTRKCARFYYSATATAPNSPS